jgi:hypothetical protein
MGTLLAVILFVQKVSNLVQLLCKITIKRTFQNLVKISREHGTPFALAARHR